MFEFGDIWFNPIAISELQYDRLKQEVIIIMTNGKKYGFSDVRPQEFKDLIHDKIGNG